MRGVGEQRERPEEEAADDLDREEDRVRDEREDQGATSGVTVFVDGRILGAPGRYGCPGPRRSVRAASLRNSSSTSVRSFSSSGGQPLGLTRPSMLDSSTGRRSLEAW